jgi:CRISPR/Cas system-associated protein endoribonuclease Cas2
VERLSPCAAPSDALQFKEACWRPKITSASKSTTTHSTDVIKVTNRTFNRCRQSHQPHIQWMSSKSPTAHSTDVVKVTNRTFNGCRQSHQPHIQRMSSMLPTAHSTDVVKVTNRTFNGCDPRGSRAPQGGLHPTGSSGTARFWGHVKSVDIVQGRD